MKLNKKNVFLWFVVAITFFVGLIADELGDFYPGRIVVCFSEDMIGNSRGEIDIQVVNGIINTPFSWLNDLARDYEIIRLERKYWVKDQDWNLNGQYPMNVFLLESTQHSRTNSLVDELISYTDVIFAERESIGHFFSNLNDPLISEQWYLEKIQAYESWDIVYDETEREIPEVVIGIIDSGIKWNHEDLADNMWINEAELPGITINWQQGIIIGGDCPGSHTHVDGVICLGDNDGNGYCDDVMGWDFAPPTHGGGQPNNPFQNFAGNPHGTSVAGAGIAVANNRVGIAGVAYKAKILATKHQGYLVYNIDNRYSGIYYMADTGAHIINCSWGDDNHHLADLAVEYARDKGSLVVAAVGNGDWHEIHSPAKSLNSIAVTSTNRNDIRTGVYNTLVDISAPGVDILSSSFNTNGNDVYIENFGTSFATPIVSGVAALLLSQKSNLTVDELKYHLMAGSDSIDHLNPGFEGLIGAGRVNAFNSLILVNKFEKISENTIIGRGHIDLKNYFIDGATLTIEDAIVGSETFTLSHHLGFKLFNQGKLIIKNSVVWLGDGLMIGDEGTEIIIESSVVHAGNGSRIYLESAHITFEDSTLNTTGIFIELKRNSSISLTDNSSWIGASAEVNNVNLESSQINFNNSIFEADNVALNMIDNSLFSLNSGSVWASQSDIPSSFELASSQITVNNSLINLDNIELTLTKNSILSVANSSFTISQFISSSIYDAEMSRVELDNSFIEISNTIINTNDTFFKLSGGSRITLNEQSIWLANSTEIMGQEIDDIFGDSNTDPIDFPAITNGTLQLTGDGIYVNNSAVKFDTNSKIGDTGSQFDGIFISGFMPGINNAPELNVFAADILGAQVISVINGSLCFEMNHISESGTIYVNSSYLEILNTNITAIHKLYLSSNSRFNANNFTYFENTKGIVLKNSTFIADSLFIIDNDSTGLTIDGVPSFSIGGESFSKSSTLYNEITNSSIQGNSGSGILLLQDARVSLKNTLIHENDEYGFLSLSNQISMIYGPSVISDNGSAEISALYNAFPTFHYSLPGLTLPSVIDNVNSGGDDHFLLRAEGSLSVPLNPPLYIYKLNVSTSDLSRFYPCSSCYWFYDYIPIDHTGTIIRGIYDDGMEAIEDEDYAAGLLALQGIVDDYPDSVYAIYSIAIMPHLYNILELDIQDFFDYLDIAHPNLTVVIKHTKAMTLMFIEEYEEAIEIFEEIIQDPVGDLEMLLAIKSQLFCIQKLLEQGMRSIPKASAGVPSSYAEYRQMDEAIMSQIMSLLQNNKSEPPIDIIPLETRLLSNFPNPFNPVTTIIFELAIDSIVSIDIYNIRGQRVRTLANDYYPAGNHSVAWHGTDENGREVASGIYFYQMRTDGFSQVKRMVLLK